MRQRRFDDFSRVIRLFGCPVPSSAAQSRKLDRKPCGTAAILWFWRSLGSLIAEIGCPPALGNTSGLPPPSVRATTATVATFVPAARAARVGPVALLQRD